MCKSMSEFEKLIQTLQAKKVENENLKKEIKAQEDELKAYMKKRKKNFILKQQVSRFHIRK